VVRDQQRSAVLLSEVVVKPLAKYVQLLEKELEFLRVQFIQSRLDVEFYRGKCERLELAVMSVTVAPAAAEYVARSEQQKPGIREVKLRSAPTRLPFSDLKHKWNAMTAEQQEKAIQEGWTVEQEENHEGQ
jgi:hypothetical protein